MKSRGFSLIELTVVLLIMAIAAAAVMLRVQGPLRSAQMRDTLGAIGQFDRMTRIAAKEQDRPLQLVVDLTAGQLRRTDKAGRAFGSAPLKLPSGFRIERLLVRKQNVVGSATISFSRHGLTPSYAMLLVGGGRRVWLMVAGLTGELVQVENDEQILETMATTGVRRNAR